MFASICLRVLSRIQRGGARLVTDFTPKPLAPVTAADRHALGSLLTGIGFAALGIGAGTWFAVCAVLAVIR